MTKTGMIKTPEEIEKIAAGGKLLNNILQNIIKMVSPGVTTKQLSSEAEKQMLALGAIPSFKGYGSKKNPFPAALCVSINDEIVHGIPSHARTLQEGDIVGLDIGMIYLDLFTDMAVTVGVGKISALAQKLIDTTKKSMEAAIKEAKVGNKMGDIGHAAQKTAEDAGFSMVRDLVGHGVGYAVHESPEVPNYGTPNTGISLEAGMVLAIEPMLCEKDYQVVMEDDGWTISTMDGGLSAHFEHTIAITQSGPRILTL